MNIIQDFIPVGRGKRPGIPIIGPKYITIHDTANSAAGANALMHARYLKSDDAAKRPASWHMTVDDTRIVQHLPLEEIAWHAGDGHGPGNMSSIAIEICENVDGDREQAETNTAELVADLLKRFGLPIESIVQHNRWSGKNCPHIIRVRAGGWEQFIERVKSKMEKPGPFPDVDPGRWSSGAIQQVKDAGIMAGYPSGEFKPSQPVTREELAVVISKILGRVK